MDKSFDDLFDDFFERRKDEISLNSELKRIIDAISKFKKMSEGEDLDNAINDELGKPDETEELIEDGMIFKKLIWNTPHGKFVKIVVSDIESEPEPVTVQKTLQQQLEEAVEAEDYELAIKLRDQIKNEKKIEKKSK